MEEQTEKLSPEQTAILKKLRWIAGGCVALVAAAPFVAMPLMGSEVVKASMNKGATSVQSSANVAAIAVFIAAVVVGWVCRMQAYKAHWQADAVTPAGYAKGITRFVLALVLGVWGCAAIGLWAGYPPALLLAAPAALLLLFLGFPDGKPMLPLKPQLGERKP